MPKTTVTVIPGDGIGPEVVASAVRLVDATGVPIVWGEQHAGASVFTRGIASSVPSDTIELLARTWVVLKGPLETPVGYGEKSANVTLRKLFETYANVQPVANCPASPSARRSSRTRAASKSCELRSSWLGPRGARTSTARPGPTS